jgi:hypothetical protein
LEPDASASSDWDLCVLSVLTLIGGAVNKQLLVTEISCLLDRGVAPVGATGYFADRGHDELVEEFREYLEMHGTLIGASHLEITQALNDRGTDLLLEKGDSKVGFQLKSHNDVSEDDFAKNVKRQLAESLAHGLDKWYLLICSPLQHAGDDYSGRIAHLMNEISALQTHYVGAYGPRSTVLYFDGPEPVSSQEFDLEVQRRTYEQTSLEAVLTAIDLSVTPDKPAAIIDDSDRYTARPPQTLESFARVVEWPEDVQPESEVAGFIEVIDRLEQLPRLTRELLTIIVRRATGDWGELNVLASEVHSATQLTRQTFNDQIAILERHGFVRLWTDRQTVIDLLEPIWWFYELKRYCELTDASLETLIVDLDFRCLD